MASRGSVIHVFSNKISFNFDPVTSKKRESHHNLNHVGNLKANELVLTSITNYLSTPVCSNKISAAANMGFPD
jgi:hypothetical protein